MEPIRQVIISEAERLSGPSDVLPRLSRLFGVSASDFSIDVSLELGVDEDSGEHYVRWPDFDRLTAADDSGYQTQVYESGEIRFTLPQAPSGLMPFATREALISLTVLPSGAMAEAVPLWSKPGPPDRELEESLLDELWGYHLPETGVDEPVNVTVLLRGRRRGRPNRGPSATWTESARVYTNDSRLFAWIREIDEGPVDF
jgi:hypothetical protein